MSIVFHIQSMISISLRPGFWKRTQLEIKGCHVRLRGCIWDSAKETKFAVSGIMSHCA